MPIATNGKSLFITRIGKSFFLFTYQLLCVLACFHDVLITHDRTCVQTSAPIAFILVRLDRQFRFVSGPFWSSTPATFCQLARFVAITFATWASLSSVFTRHFTFVSLCTSVLAFSINALATCPIHLVQST